MPSSLSFRLRTFSGLFVAAAAFILFNAWFLSYSFKASDEAARWVEHTYQVVNQLETAFGGLKDAESGQRGYIILPNNRSLENRNNALRTIDKSLADLRRLVGDNPVQVANVDKLTTLAQERLKILDDALEAYQKNPKTSTVHPFFLKGQDSMVPLRNLVTQMQEMEISLLQKRKADAASQSGFVYITLIGATLINLAMITLFFIFFRKHMIAQAAENHRRTKEAYLKSGEADAGVLVGGDLEMSIVGGKIIEFVSARTGAPAVNLYLEKNGSLELEAGSVEGSTTRYPIGKGLVGQAFTSKDPTLVEDVPSDFFKLSSAMGSRLPTAIYYLPLMFRRERLGVLEVASFAKPSEEQQEWLTQVASVLGVGLSAVRSRARLQELLEETQRQAEELQMQQEELRTTNEELEEQTKALLESQRLMQVQAEELRQINEELEQQTRALETQQEALNLKNQALETSRRKIEEKAAELERASAYKSEFLAKMSHELRTPLNSLMILATLLQENKERNLNSQQIDFARTIYDAGTDLLELINDILDLSKLEARKLAARPEAIDVKAFSEQCVSMFRKQAEAKNIEIACDIAPNAATRLVTDRQRLQQIVRNLLSNSLKFTEKGKVTLEIRAGAAPDRIVFAVRDTGVGIADAKKQLIWEAFEQADGSISRKYGGTGLGLTISRELAHLLGGHIAVESQEGKGSRFALEIAVDLTRVSAAVERIPRPQNSATASSHAPSEIEYKEAPATPTDDPFPPVVSARDQAMIDESLSAETDPAILAALQALPKTARTILIVEDDDVFRRAVVDAARSHGFTPLEAADGAQALAILKSHSPHAMLLDIKLPDVSGMALLDRVKAMPTLRHVPIHMISALDYQHSALRMGAIGYLGKPVTIEGVRGALSRIEKVIDKKVKKLLIVEDDAKSRKAITELVGAKDTEVIAVESGREAIEILRKGGADCVILDLKLPDMSGFDLLEDIGENQGVSLPPVIVYTGKDLSKEEQERLRRYSDSIILKGAKSPERLLDEVNLFLHRMEADLPDDKRSMLANMRTRDKNFDGCELLLVDDDLRNLFALTSALEGKGFKVTVARDGLEALSKLDSHPEIKVVLMDIMMPRMDGFEAMQKIRANPEHKKLPIIALTAKAMKGEQEKCIAAGASDYLPKPINLTNLLSVLKVWVPSQDQVIS